MDNYDKGRPSAPTLNNSPEKRSIERVNSPISNKTSRFTQRSIVAYKEASTTPKNARDMSNEYENRDK